MSNLDAVWGQTQAGEFTEDVMPPVGVYVPQVHEFKAAQSKAGEFYVAVGFRDQQYQWSDVRVLTKNGVPQEGRIKACKIMLRQLGINPDTPPSHLAAVGAQVVGRYYSVEIVASDRINVTTGLPILNTNITSPASAPTMAAPAVQAQAPPQTYAQAAPAPAPIQAQVPAGVTSAQFPAAVAGGAPTVVPQQPAPGAQFGDVPPWGN